jgi:hypothetical protein
MPILGLPIVYPRPHPPGQNDSMKIDSFELFLWKESHAKHVLYSHTKQSKGRRYLTAQDPPSVLTPKSKKVRTGKINFPLQQTYIQVYRPGVWLSYRTAGITHFQVELKVVLHTTAFRW